MTAVDIPADVGDFRLVDRRAVDAFRAMPERDRFVRGMFGWMGFKQTAVPFHRVARPAGKTKYNWARMVKLAVDGIVGFSDLPLRTALWAGLFVSLAAMGYGAYAVVMALTGTPLAWGWARRSCWSTLLAGINMMMTGIVGVYVGRIHTEVKQRPLYVVGRAIGFEQQESARLPDTNLRILAPPRDASGGLTCGGLK